MEIFSGAELQTELRDVVQGVKALKISRTDGSLI